MTRRRWFVAGLLAAAALHAAAGVPLVDDDGDPYKWDLATEQPNVKAGRVTYFPHASSLRDAVSGGKTPLQAIRDGIREWEIGTTSIRFEEDPTRPAGGADGSDRVNYVGFTRTGLDSFTLGVTTVTRTGGTLTDMDVLLNDAFIWDTFAPGQAGVADIQSLVAHEWGHALGADHVPLRASTMYPRTQPGVISLRSIAPDDRALVGRIYPNAAYQTDTGAIAGTVNVAGTTNDRAVHVVAVSVVSGEPEASTLTAPDGSYRVEGLAPGVYRLLAAPCIPLQGSMNKFWTSGSTRFVPAVLRQGGANPGPVLPLTVAAGATVTAPAITVADAAAPLEPDGTSGQARLVQLGDAACARFESGTDEDWYAFDGAQGQKVTISVLSWGLGAEADPSIRVADSTGTAIALQDDWLSPVLVGNQIQGADLDVRLVGLELNRTGRFTIRVRSQSPPQSGNGFYALFVSQSSDAPSPALTTVDATPDRIDADGQETSLLVIHPRNERGEDVGPGASVSISHDGPGSVSPVTDAGDGTYRATIVAPTAPGAHRFSVVVTTPQGTATMLDAETVVYLGPADPAFTEFKVRPRRIDAAVAGDAGLLTQATVSLVPRDALGELLGKERAVTLSLQGPAGTFLQGPVVDLGDGSYGDTVRAGGGGGSGSVSAEIDGVALGASARFAIGYAVDAVLADVVADLDAMLAVEGLAARAERELDKARRQAASAAEAFAGGGAKATLRALAGAQRTLSSVVKGRARAGVPLPNAGTERDLARTGREAAQDAIARAVPLKRRHERAVESARDDVAKGDAAFAAGDAKRALQKWRAAYARVRRLVPA